MSMPSAVKVIVQAESAMNSADLISVLYKQQNYLSFSISTGAYATFTRADPDINPLLHLSKL